MAREEKTKLVEELRGDIQNSSGFLLTDYRGLTVSELSEFRRKLDEAGANYRVVKNRLFQLAAEGFVDSELAQLLEGPTAVAFVRDDPIAPARAIAEFMRGHKTVSIKGGFVEGHLYDADKIRALSTVPPHEVLVSQLVGAVQSPIAGLVGTLQGLMSELVYTIQAVADKEAA